MIEYIIVAILVTWSAFIVFKKVFPKTANSVFTALANSFEKQGWHTVANKVRPKGVAGGCGGGCSCSSNDDKPTIKRSGEAKPVKWH